MLPITNELRILVASTEKRLTVRHVLPYVGALYRDSGTCCLARVLDDGMTGEGFVREAEERARAAGHPYCEAVAALLLRLSFSQRWRFYSERGAWQR